MHQAAETPQSTTEVAAGLEALLDAFNPSSFDLLGSAAKLDVIGKLLTLKSQIDGALATVVHQAFQADSADEVAAMSLRSWLAHHHQFTSRQAARLVKRAERLDHHRVVRQGMIDGRVSQPQADSITGTLHKLAGGFNLSAYDQAAARLVGFCDQFNSDELKVLARRELELADPELAEEMEAAALERERRIAEQTRSFTAKEDCYGVTHIRASLPTVDAAPFIAQLKALEALNRRTVLEARDPYVSVETQQMRMADALIEFSRRLAAGEFAPKHGGDRPTLMITIAAEDLAEGRTGAATLPDGHPLTSHELHVAACDANIIRIITGGPSGILDVGRAQRLVTPDIRRALAIRDQGCIFPGCDRLPADCDAHHIIPWQQGGPTSLINLMFVCRHHHGYIEPRHKDPRDNWAVDFDAFGLPVLIRPERVDPERKPIRHNRFALSA